MEPRVIEIFWKNIQKEKDGGCWTWTGRTGKRGTPIITINIDGKKTEFRPRQVSLELHNKPLSKRVESVCKNKLCVKPNHLASGDEARFWSKVCKLPEGCGKYGGCWIWIGTERRGGYGAFSFYRDGKVKHTAASRYSWELANNHTIKTHLLFVCHTCDNPRCVNPDHLYLGTTQENTKDRDDRGRGAHPKGELNAMATITDIQAKEIKDLLKDGRLRQSDIAKLYKVGRGVVQGIALGKTWTHII